MATPLDFSEQEQLEQVKAFWQRYGTVISVFLLLTALAYGGWVAWGSWKNKQALSAAALYEELDRAALAGDAAKASAVFKDMVAKYPQAVVTQHGGLLAAKAQLDKSQPDAAVASLKWVIEQPGEPALAACARLRLAGVWLDQKKYDAALQQLSAVTEVEFAALAADRRGDVLAAQGQKTAAREAYQQALKTMDAQLNYRRLVEAKLAAIGDVAVTSASAGAAPNTVVLSASAVASASAVSKAAPASGETVARAPSAVASAGSQP
jgi:predicted negative regulator of RcsB-dependent stress response